MALSNEERIINIIFAALEQINEERSVMDKFDVSRDTTIFGDNAALDSLDLVSVIVDIEAAIVTEFDQTVSLSDDRAMSEQPAPFTNVMTLTNYVSKSLT